ncbi:MAG TPA: hypothetical protein VFF49_10840 [Thermodesulfobacteriota bacterium]|nr:hypothetical protein [Thermodesulfobacteriota bacterium]
MLEEWLASKIGMIIFLIIIAVLDVVGGILEAWKTGTFKWEELPGFLQTLVLYFWAWMSAELLGFLPKYFNIDISGLAEILSQYSGTTVYVLVIGKYVSSIITHISKFIGGELLSRLGFGSSQG